MSATPIAPQAASACKTLMIQGTTSDAGKSAMVTGLCRLLARKGVKVAPFKPQNMALNSAVTVDGGEIGRAQAAQAQACFLEPHTDMNPVLLKPNSDTGAQVIIQGKAITNMDARIYHDYKTEAMKAVLDSYQRLQQQYDVILVEGAGSPAEINLRDRDIANMGFAEAVDCPVAIVADIDKGGVFAHLVGTLDLLSESEQQRTIGFMINRFRGDLGLLKPGNDWLEERTQKPVLGVIPYLHGLCLEAEDGINGASDRSDHEHRIRVVVPVLPRISNHTDFDPLRNHPQVDFHFVAPEETPPPADLVILPGSKSVQADLNWLKQQGWESYLNKHLRYGGKLLGICGGWQMLGQWLHDPQGIEGAAGSLPGLGFLATETTLAAEKQLKNVQGILTRGLYPAEAADIPVSGYEIHAGITTGEALARPLVQFADGSGDGAVSDDGQIAGSYLHGLFDQPEACLAILQWAGLEQAEIFDIRALHETAIERIADALEASLDLEQLSLLTGIPFNQTGRTTGAS